jgi:hypothetical protein
MTKPRGLRRQLRTVAGVPAQVVRVCGVGMGFNHVSDEQLMEWRRKYGARLRVLWQQEFGHPPFVDEIADAEGWDD